MKRWLKHKVRSFAVWLRTTTDRWVVPASLYNDLANKDVASMEALLAAAEREWPYDPEVAYAWTLLQFLKGDAS